MDISKLNNIELFNIVFSNSSKALESENNNLQSRFVEIYNDSTLDSQTKYLSQLNMLRESLNLSMVKTLTMTLVELFALECVSDLTDNEEIKKIFIERYRQGIDKD